MGDDQSQDIDDVHDHLDGSDYEEPPATQGVVGDESTPPAPAPAPDSVDEFADGPEEPIEDYVVNMVVNENDGQTIPPELFNAAVTDINGNIITQKTTLVDTINEYSTTVYDQLNGTSTGITGSKRWWGWSTKRILFAVLIALCILGIILAILFLVLKKLKNKKKPVQTGAAGTTATTQAAVNKNVSPNPKYHQVPSV